MHVSTPTYPTRNASSISCGISTPLACAAASRPDDDFAQEPPQPDGLYGPPHWLDERRITELLSPYVSEHSDTGDYARFTDLTGRDACRLASLLPPRARADRQNNAPTITQLLRACATIDGLLLDGYIIRAPRWDERVSIDTLCVPESSMCAHGCDSVEQAGVPSYRHWLILARVLGLDEDAPAPDDMRFIVREASGERWWWAWWD